VSSKRKFTDRFLQSIAPAPPGKRLTYWDSSESGLALRVSDKSSSFVLIRRMPKNPNPTARKLGSYPSMTLAQARVKAKAWNAEIDKGDDPAVKAAEEALPQQLQDANTFASVFAVYAQERLGRLRTGKEVQRSIGRDVLPILGKKPIASIRRQDVKQLLQGLAPIAGNRLLTHLKTFFKWCVTEEVITASPISVFPPLAKEVERDHVLNDDEIRAIWLACNELGTFGQCVQFMLLTGQRRNEVGRMTWNEIDHAERLWVLPAARTKANRKHAVPLSDLAMSVLNECPELNQYVFPSSRGVAGPISGWTHGKAALDKKSGVVGWRLHDLRRTCATNLEQGRVDFTVIQKILNHSVHGVTARYARYEYAVEKRAALDRWAARLAAIVGGGEDNVVPIRRGLS
jgi:integrase